MYVFIQQPRSPSMVSSAPVRPKADNAVAVGPLILPVVFWPDLMKNQEFSVSAA